MLSMMNYSTPFFLLILLVTLLCPPLTASEINVDSLREKAMMRGLTAKKRMEMYEKLGKAYENNYKAGDAADAYFQAIQYCREADLKSQLPQLLYNYALMASYAGRHDNALAALEEVLDLLKQHPDKQLEARAYMQLGLVHFFQENWNEALTFYERALSMATAMDNKTGISIAYNNIANIFQKKDNLKEANQYYQKALRIQRETADSASMCNCLMNIGSNLLQQNRLDEAFLSLTEAMDIANKIGDVETQALTCSLLALYYAKHSNYDKAHELLTHGEMIARAGGYNKVRYDILKKASAIYAKFGLHDLAHAYLMRANVLADSIAEEQLREKVQEFEVRFRSKEKETEIALKNQELELAQRLHLALIVITILMVGIIAILIVLSRKRHLKNQKLKAMNDTKSRLLSIISHDIKGLVIAQRMALDAILSPKNEYAPPTTKMLSSLRDSVESELTMLQNLLDWANIQIGNLVVVPVVFNLTENIRKIISLHMLPAEYKNVTLLLEAPEQCLVRADQHMINTVIRNLLSNAIKFSKSGDTICIGIKQEIDGKMRVSVADQGIGMSKQQIEHILETGKSSNITTGTNGEKGSGLGLIICKGLLERNKSKLHIDSREGRGCIFSFVLTPA